MGSRFPTLVLLLFVCHWFVTRREITAAGETEPLDARCQQIVTQFDARIGAALHNHASRDELGRILLERASALQQLVSLAEGSELNQLCAADFAGAAMACEYLRRSDDCIRFARLAMERDPLVETAYAPLIRCLLNQRRTSEAIVTLDAAHGQVPVTSDVVDLRYLVYLRLHGDGAHQQAFEQFSLTMEGMASRFEADPAAARKMTGLAQEYLAAGHAAGDDDGVFKRLVRYRDMSFDARLRASEQLGADDDAEWRRAVVVVSGLCGLQCELVRLTAPEELTTSELAWCRTILAAFARERHVAIAAELNAALQSVVANSHLFHEWNQLDDLVRTAAPTSSDPMNSDDTMDLRPFIEWIGRRKAAQRLVGRPFPNRDIIRATPSEGSNQRHAEPGRRILCVVRPIESLSLKGCGQLATWKGRSGECAPIMLCVVGTSSVAPASHAQPLMPPGSENQTDQDEERRALTAALRATACDLPVGFLDRESALFDHFAGDPEVQLVLVDDEDLICCIVSGVNRQKIEFVLQRFEELANSE
jgi:hypothetical protein